MMQWPFLAAMGARWVRCVTSLGARLRLSAGRSMVLCWVMLWPFVATTRMHVGETIAMAARVCLVQAKQAPRRWRTYRAQAVARWRLLQP